MKKILLMVMVISAMEVFAAEHQAPTVVKVKVEKDMSFHKEGEKKSVKFRVQNIKCKKSYVFVMRANEFGRAMPKGSSFGKANQLCYIADHDALAGIQMKLVNGIPTIDSSREYNLVCDTVSGI